MPFLAEEQAPVSTKDILSWSYDEPLFDQDMPLYIDATNPSRSITANEARVLIRKLVAGLRKAGLKPGDTVCIASFNDVYYPILVLGIIAAGCVFTGTNPGYMPFELEHHIRVSHAKLVICEPELIEPVLAGGEKLGLSGGKILIFDHHEDIEIPAGYRSWRTLLEQGEEDWVRFDDLEKSKTTNAMLLFSSGTSGLPKAAELSHYNLVAQHELAIVHKSPPWKVKRLTFLPMFHAAVSPSIHITPLRSGQQSYILRRFDVEAFLQAVQTHRITDFLVVPPCILAVVLSPLATNYDLTSIRWARVGGAPVDKGIQARFQALLGPSGRITQVWAMTETSCIATQFEPGEANDTGAIGRFVPNMDAKIVDDDGKDVTGFGVSGELCVKGPTVVRGYFENEEANKRDWDADGFFHTGDVVYRDGKTRLWYIVDRKKELIKSRGFQVAPPEVEGVLLTHPSVADTAVIGVYDDAHQTELVRAYVVRKAGAALGEDEVKRWVSDRLVKYKRLEGGVRFIDAIPRTASGKVLKRVLREEAEAERVEPAKSKSKSKL